MSARPFALVLILASAATAVVSWNPLASTMVAACLVFFLVGYMWKRPLPTLLAGLLLYPPLAWALTTTIPATWSYLASGLFSIIICERMTFEYEVSAVLGSPTGIDAETKSLASELSKEHTKKVFLYVALAALVIAGSVATSAFTSYATVLTTAVMLLMLAILVYAKR
jgi:hypothetical protein